MNQTATAFTLLTQVSPTEPVTPLTSSPIPSASEALLPSITVSDQVIQNRQVVVNDVVSSGSGWLVIYSVTNGYPDQRLGYIAVHDGDNKDVAVPVDPGQATGSLVALLHTDTGKLGTFEYPGPDAPVIRGLQIVSAQFHVNAGQEANVQQTPSQTMATIMPKTVVTGTPMAGIGSVGQSASIGQLAPGGQRPFVTVIDQPIHDGLVIIPEVYSLGDMWLVIHPQYPDGSLGNYIGYALLHDGLNTNVRILLDTSRTKATLVAMLHINQSRARVPQYPGVDTPFMLNGEMVAPAFKIHGPLTGDVLITQIKEGGVLHLADGFGLALYVNTNNYPGMSTCIGDCLGSFRPLLAIGKFHLGDGITMSQMGTLSLADGMKQVTYLGAPLYYNVEDTSPSDVHSPNNNEGWELARP